MAQEEELAVPNHKRNDSDQELTGTDIRHEPAEPDREQTVSLKEQFPHSGGNGQVTGQEKGTMAARYRSPYLVFDIGGSRLRAGVYDPEADTIAEARYATTVSRWTTPDEGGDLILRRLGEDLVELAGQLDIGGTPSTVCAAVPGPVARDGRVLALPTILGGPEQPAFDALSCFQDAWPGSAVLVVNDVTAAGFALKRCDDEDFCVMTVSSGIGLKVFVGGQPVVGNQGRGGEIGHLVVDTSSDANPCECGGRGHLGAVSSGRGVVQSIRRQARKDREGFGRSSLSKVAIEDISEYDVANAFRDEDPWTLAVISHAATAIGQVLAALHTALGVERLVLIGGFAVALGEGYRSLVASAAAATCWDLGEDWREMIELADVDGLAGLLGAGRFARMKRAGI